MKKFTLFILTLMAATMVSAKQTILFKGEKATGNWAASLSIDKSSFANLTAGDILFVDWTKDTDGATAAAEDWYQLTVADGTWATKLINSYNGKHVFCYVHTLTADEVTTFKSKGMVLGGHFINITRVGFFNATDASEVQYWSSTLSDWTTAAANNPVFPTGWGSAALNIDNLKDLEIGDVITVDFTHADGIGEWDAQLQITLAHASDPWVAFIDVPVGLLNSISLTVDASNKTNLTTGDVRLNGKDVTITNIRTLKSASKCYLLSTQGGISVSDLPTTEAIDVDLTRKFDWNTSICLPFDVDDLSVFGHSAKAYEFTSASSTSITFTERSKIKAGVPYYMTFDMTGVDEADKTYTVSFNDITIDTDFHNPAESGGLTFKGNYTPGFDMEGKYGVSVVQHGENWDWGFYKGGTGSKLNAFSAYIEGAPASARLMVNLDEETTGVADVRSKMADERSDIFNLNGQRIAQPTKGLYIVNGRKVIVK